MPAQAKLKLGKLLKEHPRYGPLGMYYIGGGKILGDIIGPVVPYEDYTFDENNICPEAYALRIAAIKPRKRKSK
jgi:hypothetical protein